MKLKPIKSKKDYEAYLEWADSLFDKKVKPNSPDGEALQVALLLIRDYEDKHYPVPTGSFGECVAGIKYSGFLSLRLLC